MRNTEKIARGTVWGILPVLLFLLLFWICVIPAEGQENDHFNEVTVERAKEMIHAQGGEGDLVLLDTRTRAEYDKDHLENALFFDFSSEQFWEDIGKLDKDKTYLVYCFDGGRSGKTVQYMKEHAFREAHNIKGGIVAWKRSGYPVIRE